MCVHVYMCAWTDTIHACTRTCSHVVYTMSNSSRLSITSSFHYHWHVRKYRVYTRSNYCIQENQHSETSPTREGAVGISALE